MRSPAATTYLYGDPLVVLGLTGATAFLGYAWLAEGASWLPAVALGFFTAGSYRAADRLNAFRRWKSEWDTMGGGGEKRVPIRPPRILGYLFAAVVWIVAALASLAYVSEPGAAVPVLIFWGGSAVMAVMGWRMFARQRAAQTSKDHPVVRVTVPAPRGGNAVREAYNALPDYCLNLFRAD